jgi:DNA-binding beta-propeller fold protein YncE
MRRQLVILLFVLLSLGEPAVRGQRVFMTLDPSQPEEELHFDPNEVPLILGPNQSDLNYSPNVVFTPDSSKAFVSYTFSNKVLAFNPKTGEILGLVDVPESPGHIALMPGGDRVAVLCAFINENGRSDASQEETQPVQAAIAAIDVDTLEVQTLTMEAFFSVGNNMVFSGDGGLGIVASSGTDEILRFDTTTLQEVEPRLQMPGGTRPTTLRMTPDGSRFFVVTVGSTLLTPAEERDAVTIVDTASFSVVTTIVPDPEQETPPHDFQVGSGAAISPDGRYGLVADRQLGALQTLAELGRDRATLFDIQTGQVVRIFDVGGVPVEIVPTPDGKWFVLLSNLNLQMIPIPVPDENGTIDADSLEVVSFQPRTSDFRDTSRPVFLDGNTMMLGAPMDDVLLQFKLNTGELLQPILVGQKLRGFSEDLRPEVPGAPLDVAVSPDGEAMTAVNFNLGTIELLRPSRRLFLPYLLSSQEWFTAVNVTNLSSRTSDIMARGVNVGGIRFQDLNDTEDIVEFGANPTNLTIVPGGQLSTTVREVVSADRNQFMEGWMLLDDDQAQAQGFFRIGDRGERRRLDAASLSSKTAQKVVLPEVRVRDGFTTEVSILNPNSNSTDVSVRLYTAGGDLIFEDTRNTLGGLVLRGALGDEIGFFQGLAYECFATGGVFLDDFYCQKGTCSDNGEPCRDDSLAACEDPEQATCQPLTENGYDGSYITVESEQGIMAYQRWFDEERMAMVDGLVVEAPGVVPAETLYLPQAVTFGGSETHVNLVHQGADEMTVQLTLMDNEGESLEVSPTLDLAPGEGLRMEMAAIFPNLADTGGLVSGWIKIEGSQPGVVGSAELQLFAGKGMISTPAVSAPDQEYLLPYLAHGGVEKYRTGLVFLNPGTDETTATVKLTVRSAGGDPLVEEATLTLENGHRQIAMAHEIFSGLPATIGGSIAVSSDQPIVVMEIIFTEDLEKVSNIPPQVID